MCVSFSFGFEGEMWDFVVLILDQCLSFYFEFPIKMIKNIAHGCFICLKLANRGH